MEEVHHIHKLDHPSGTAITLAEQIIENLDRIRGYESTGVRWRENTPDDESNKVVNADGSVCCCGTAANNGQASSAPDLLPITSIREGEVPGIHSISYDSDADKITITHDAHSRRGFALGAVLAAEYTKEHQGLLTISDMFNF
jgi:4-hydroxy-tetrahydrodipicolinate reductase